MRTIGFDGGHTVYELGPVSDAVMFFECLNAFVVAEHSGQDWSLLSDRLYRRYLLQEELEASWVLMEKARRLFLALPASSVEWDAAMQADPAKTWLDASQGTLGDIFARYFDLFSKARASVVSFSDAFGIYRPLRVVVSDMPALMIEKKRPLGEYEALEASDLPFWLR